MSLTFKLLSLAVRTAAKPIGNYIKRQAKEHDGFRRFAINQAQRVHRIDMRMRLGILHDPEAQQRMHEREQRAAEEKKKQAEAPTVRTEEEQRKHDEQTAQAEKSEKEGRKKDEKPPKVKIRPLSDARAIELGANFFSEAFIFGVAVALLLLENYRSRNKESSRRDEVTERLAGLEEQIERLRTEHNMPALKALDARGKRRESSTSWWSPKRWWKSDDCAIPNDENESDAARAGSNDASNPAISIASPVRQDGQATSANRSLSKVDGEAIKQERANPPVLLKEVTAAKAGR